MHSHAVASSLNVSTNRKLTGGGERDRTDDLLRARQALSQLSYTPDERTKLMVGLDGFEPSTSRLSGVRSNQTELQAPASAWLNAFIAPNICNYERAYLISQN